ncbi:MAG: phosphate signaling complex protein PhoU [Parasporobacterium sp.]|nr:phosphate signaling complex protein PhoU [Parasporobacterium sp.]
MPRNRFDEQLAELNSELIRMGAMCEEAIGLSVKALTTNEIQSARQVFAVDSEIDQMEREIENLCLKLLLQQQPVARDLRQISAALKMITDMERIGDQASDIAEIITYMDGRNAESFEPIVHMADATRKMVTDSIDAYVKRDINLAAKVIDQDDVVDDDFLEVKKSLIGRVADNPDDGEYILDLLMIAKYFERIGDHAVNIAEWVVFSVTGLHKSSEV